MIAEYLNQTATWKRVIGENEWAEPITETQTIKVRWEGKRRLVRDKKGQEIVSEARFFCLEDVQTGDIIEYEGREWTILTVSEKVDFDGNLIYREAAC
jgi:hypothetical protein